MDRRDFLKAGFAAGGLVATSSLPLRAEDDASLFPSRGVFERLELSYQHIHIGLPRPFSVLHISDTHLTEAYPDETPWRDFCEKRRRTFGGCQQSALAVSLAWAKENVDYVLHTGDLVDFPTKANLDLVARYYGGGDNRLGCTGNHEYQREPFERGISPTADYNALSRADLDRPFGRDTLFTSRVVEGVNFITLDQAYGTVTRRQVERFDAEVAKGLPIILCMHVPFLTDHIWLASERYWAFRGKKFRIRGVPPARGDLARQRNDEVTRDFVARLKEERLLKGILCGHLHIDVQDRFSPTAMQYVVGGNFMYHGEEILFT